MEDRGPAKLAGLGLLQSLSQGGEGKKAAAKEKDGRWFWCNAGRRAITYVADSEPTDAVRVGDRNACELVPCGGRVWRSLVEKMTGVSRLAKV